MAVTPGVCEAGARGSVRCGEFVSASHALRSAGSSVAAEDFRLRANMRTARRSSAISSSIPSTRRNRCVDSADEGIPRYHSSSAGAIAGAGLPCRAPPHQAASHAAVLAKVPPIPPMAATGAGGQLPTMLPNLAAALSSQSIASPLLLRLPLTLRGYERSRGLLLVPDLRDQTSPSIISTSPSSLSEAESLRELLLKSESHPFLPLLLLLLLSSSSSSSS